MSAGARCGQHPEAAAVATCARCGVFLCGDCTEVVGERPYCAACVDHLKRNLPPSRVVQGALALNVVGLACLPCSLALPLPTLVAGLCGVVLATRELRGPGRGERGRTQAQVTLALGGLNLLLSVGWLVALRFLP